jgi:hypothetical protein
MSRLVHLRLDEYARDAFNGFAPTDRFSIDNARALMWMSQLAYEAYPGGNQDIIREVGSRWQFVSVTPFARDHVGLNATYDTCGVIGVRQDAVIIAFAGTDPGEWKTVITDVTLRPGTDTHAGFQAAADAVQEQVRTAIGLTNGGAKPLFFTGHSLGGAVAALAAMFAVSQQANPAAVYVYGMPRAGKDQFRQQYNSSLGDRTYRLVHGIDLVARVPNSGLGYRHVGHLVQCGSHQKFAATALVANVNSDDPGFAQELLDIAGAAAGDLLAHKFLSPDGPGPFGVFFKFIPPPIREHLQDQYWTALTP